MARKPQSEVATPIKIALDAKEKRLIQSKLQALYEFQDAQARLTKANIQLLEAGIRPELGVLCW